MFNKNGNTTNDRVIYQARPNMILGCKKAIFALILLIVVLSVSGPIIQYIGEMQVYLISYVKLSLTKYTAIAVFLIMLILVLYIIFQIMGWYSKEYILTDSKITVKSGIIFTNKNYIPYSAIQDINTSQSIIARIFNVGSVSVYSAYDNNQVSLDNISNPSEVEEIIFSKISNHGFYNSIPNNNQFINNNSVPNNNQFPNNNSILNNNSFHNDNGPANYQIREEYYDDDSITPITHESNYQKNHHNNYEYYPQDLDYENERRHYEYEPYPNQDLEYNIDRAMSSRNENHKSNHNGENYYNRVRQDYSHKNNSYYDDNEPELYYNDADSQDVKSKKDDMDESGENLIRRHFDKFKK